MSSTKIRSLPETLSEFFVLIFTLPVFLSLFFSRAIYSDSNFFVLWTGYWLGEGCAAAAWAIQRLCEDMSGGNGRAAWMQLRHSRGLMVG